MAAGDLFKKAARYRKQHPGMTMPEAVKALSKKTGKKKPAARKKKAAPKKRAVGKVKPRKIKIKIKPGKKGSTRVAIGKKPAARKKKSIVKDMVRFLGISGISMSKIQQELTHQRALVSALEKHKTMLKAKGLRLAEKAAIRRDITHYKNAIAASKRHITALKRSI